MKPVLLFDGECGFCRFWVSYWKRVTGDRVSYRPFQEAGREYPHIPPADFRKSMKLVLPSGELFSGAHAAFRLLAEVPGKGWMLWMYRHVPGAAAFSEFLYRMVARCRHCAFHATAFLFGTSSEPSRIHARAFLWLMFFLLFFVALVLLLVLARR
jgi:predicted DCC family thiol-disulfide oxidoreductase YuxK